MVRPKNQAKKQQKRGIDFKKIKRKLGRKLPPPKNTTNTEVKSKAIVLPEQSVASEKAGLAVSKKGLTLKELLQQTSHHNAKVRKDALIGIKDLFLKYPAELKLHKLPVIGKVCERINDDDKLVRETLYILFKKVVFPGCKEEKQGPSISCMMRSIFNAMDNTAIDVRLMAFKFVDLVLQFYPASFSLYTEKILQKYRDGLQKNLYLQDRGRLKSVLGGLACCLSLLPRNNRDDDLSIENVVADRRILHAFELDVTKDSAGISVIKKELEDLLPILIRCFLDFVPLVQTAPELDAQSFDCVRSLLLSIDLAVKFFVQDIDNPSPHARTVVKDQIVLSVILKKLLDVFPLSSTHQLSEKDDDRYFILNVIVSEVFLSIGGWSLPPFSLLEKFLGFIGSALSKEIQSSLPSGKASRQKHLLPLIPFIPKLITQVDGSWKSHILQAFTSIFKNCNPDSSMKMACLSAIEEMLVPVLHSLSLSLSIYLSLSCLNLSKDSNWNLTNSNQRAYIVLIPSKDICKSKYKPPESLDIRLPYLLHYI